MVTREPLSAAPNNVWAASGRRPTRHRESRRSGPPSQALLGYAGVQCWSLADADHLAAGGAEMTAKPGGWRDAAVGDVDGTVRSGREAGWEEQLAHTEVRAVAVPVDPHNVTGRIRARTLVQPAGLELGGVERSVRSESAALHRGQAAGPHARPLPGNDPPDARMSWTVEAA